MTEEEARAIVERYEALLGEIAGPRAVLMCDLPIQFDTSGQVVVRETDWAEWPCLRVSRSLAGLFFKVSK